MIFNKLTAEKTAELLLQINAIKLNSQTPFVWASGWKSPIYCDNRIILSFPEVRNYICDEFIKNINKNFNKPDVIAGVATGAIGIAMLVADRLGLPFVYVRPEPKKHGRKNQIEGLLNSGNKVLVVEDLISTGKSSLQAVDALRNSDVEVIGMTAIFSYGFEVAEKNFTQNKVQLYTLSNYENLLQTAMQKEVIKSTDLELLNQWRTNPEEWDVK
ncbi:MAG: orotate phosphoribosyltransferase [Bacteroidota bacterium]|nr:orotate phosphoribosyltransferase [Bacteroidota bacterium]